MFSHSGCNSQFKNAQVTSYTFRTILNPLQYRSYNVMAFLTMTQEKGHRVIKIKRVHNLGIINVN